MILVDLSQIFISNLMASFGKEPELIEENLVRHMIFNSLRYYRSKFSDAGDMVLCCDHKESWRRDEFKYYKANRRKKRAKSRLNWDEVYHYFNVVKAELDECSPYYVVEVKGAEGDDVIAVAASTFKDEEVIIISDDKDLKQLQRYSHVKQFSPNKKQYLTTDDAEELLKDHILRGDSSDGIPNFLSPDNIFTIEGKRQKSVYAKKVNEWLYMEPEDFCEDDDQLRNYKRNEKLIDLRQIPATIRKEIKRELETQFESGPNGDRASLRKLFIKYRMRELLDVLQQF